MGMIIVLLVSFLIYFVKGIIFLDPDFGWHVKIGELITSSGFLFRDPFSYTMPSFPYIDIQWFSNVIFHSIYSLAGMYGLSLIYSLLMFLALVVIIKSLGKKIIYWEVPVILTIGILFSFFGVRPQVASWFLWALFLGITLNEYWWKKWRFFLPPLTLLWVNLHGSFALSITTLLLIGAVRLYQKKLRKDFILLILLSTLASFVNPYGPRIWHEVWLQMSDSSLRWSILEWQPVFLTLDLVFFIYATLSVMLVLHNRKKFRPEELVLYFFFLVQAVSSIRHIPLWTILSLPMTIASFGYTLDTVNKIPQAISRFNKIYQYTLYAAVVILFLQSILVLKSAMAFGEETFYPKIAVIYLRENLPQGNLFSEYGWGGYLIWKLPERPVFIDGRMPSWRYKLNPPDETGYAMKDYTGLLNGEIAYRDVFEKYSITAVLWPKNRQMGYFEAFAAKISERFFGKKEQFDLLKALKKDGWQMVYEDKISIVFESPQ